MTVRINYTCNTLSSCFLRFTFRLTSPFSKIYEDRYMLYNVLPYVICPIRLKISREVS